MDLAQFSSRDFDRGRSRLVEALWLLVRALAFASINPSNFVRVASLRAFGARLGPGVVIKPGVKVKFPWRLEVGEQSWIGEDVWIDNLAEVAIGAHSCVSQGAYLCTGNHDWKSETFDLIVAPIRIGREAWVAAKAIVGPGVVIGDRTVVTLGTVVSKDVPPDSICSGSEPNVTARRTGSC